MKTVSPGIVWCLDQIQTKVESAVKKVISVGDDEVIDHQISLMNMGLDSLGTAPLA